MKLDRSAMDWNASITDEEILDRTVTTHYAMRTNQHIKEFQLLTELMEREYKVVAEFKYLGYNGHSIYANGQTLVTRPNKKGDFKLGHNVSILSHNFSHKGGGTNQYPAVSDKTGECVLEFYSYGLPSVSLQNGWSMNVISMIKQL